MKQEEQEEQEEELFDYSQQDLQIKAFDLGLELSETKMEVERLMDEIDKLKIRVKMETCVATTQRKKYQDLAGEYNQLLKSANFSASSTRHALQRFKPITEGRKRNQTDFDF